MHAFVMDRRAPAFAASLTVGRARATAGAMGSVCAPGVSRRVSAAPVRRARVGVAPSMNIVRPPRVASGWSRSLSTFFQSRVLRAIQKQITLSLTVSSMVVAGHFFFREYTGTSLPSLPTMPHSLLATSVSLLLVFRTNAAYDRFWEGRKIWGSIVNSSRNCVRMAATTLRPPEARLAAALVASFTHATAQRLQARRAEEPVKTILADYPEVEQRVRVAFNKPLECMLVCGEIAREQCRMEEYEFVNPRGTTGNLTAERMIFETYIGELVVHLGACERICTCPVPLSYSRHCSRLISLFVLSLPFVLVGQAGGEVISVPATVFLTWALCGIDEVAHLIEDPFLGEPWSLDIDVLAGKITRDTLEQITLPEPSLPEVQSIAAGK